MRAHIDDENVNENIRSSIDKVKLKIEEVEEVETLTLQLNESIIEINELNNQINHYRNSDSFFKSADNKIAELDTRIEELTNQSYAVEADNKKLQEKHDVLTKENKNLVSKRNEIDELNTVLNDEKKELQKQVDTLKQRLEITNNFKKEIELKLTIKLNKLQKNEKKLTLVTKDNNSLQARLEIVRKLNASISEDNDSLNVKFKEVKATNASLTNELNVSKENLKIVNTALFELKEEIKATNEKNKSEIDHLRSINKKSQGDITELAKINSKLSQENEKLKRQIFQPTTTKGLEAAKNRLVAQKQVLLEKFKKSFLNKYQSKNGLIKSFVKWVVKKLFHVEIFKEWTNDNITQHFDYEIQKANYATKEIKEIDSEIETITKKIDAFAPSNLKLELEQADAHKLTESSNFDEKIKSNSNNYSENNYAVKNITLFAI